MYTQCPDCQTRFRVTAAVLRAARGTVRCGRCGSAFDALDRLSDSLEPAEPALEPLFISVPPISLSPEVARSLDERAPEPAEVLVDETATTETITLEGEHVSVDVEPEAVEAESSGDRGEPKPAEEEALDFELGDDLDATDRYEVLDIEASRIQDDRDAERELEELVLRLQREFGPDIVESADSLEHDEETAETEAIAEATSPELTPDDPVFVDVTPNGAVTSVPDTWLESVMKHGVLEPVDRRRGAPLAASQDLLLEPEPPSGAAATPGESLTEPFVATPAGAKPEPVGPIEVPEDRPLRVAAVPTVDSDAEPMSLSARRFRPTSTETETEPEAQRSGWATFAWAVGSLLLVVVLAVQVVDHWRDAIARDARFGALLRAAYERVGIDLPPSRDLAALKLQQLSVEDRDSGRMVVRANVTNRAGFAQPMPILRLQLEDRYGSIIAARDFQPSEYLASGAAADSMLGPGATSEAELVLADPGPEAVGYRLDVCLGDTGGQLRCAQPPGPG
jgi:predicted Zn finger-like uncharacterized protein